MVRHKTWSFKYKLFFFPFQSEYKNIHRHFTWMFNLLSLSSSLSVFVEHKTLPGMWLTALIMGRNEWAQCRMSFWWFWRPSPHSKGLAVAVGKPTWSSLALAFQRSLSSNSVLRIDDSYVILDQCFSTSWQAGVVVCVCVTDSFEDLKKRYKCSQKKNWQK